MPKRANVVQDFFETHGFGKSIFGRVKYKQMVLLKDPAMNTIEVRRV